MLTVCLTALALALPRQAHAQVSTEEPTASDSVQAPADALMQVNPKYACMINDRRFEEKQIPVRIGGKTYYGCCQMCVKTLNEDPDSRTASIRSREKISTRPRPSSERCPTEKFVTSRAKRRCADSSRNLTPQVQTFRVDERHNRGHGFVVA